MQDEVLLRVKRSGPMTFRFVQSTNSESHMLFLSMALHRTQRLPPKLEFQSQCSGKESKPERTSLLNFAHTF